MCHRSGPATLKLSIFNKTHVPSDQHPEGNGRVSGHFCGPVFAVTTPRGLLRMVFSDHVAKVILFWGLGRNCPEQNPAVGLDATQRDFPCGYCCCLLRLLALSAREDGLFLGACLVYKQTQTPPNLES